MAIDDNATAGKKEGLGEVVLGFINDTYQKRIGFGIDEFYTVIWPPKPAVGVACFEHI